MEALFRAACLREPSQRAAFLKSACGGDERLRNEVAWLLTSDKQFRTDSGEPSAAPGAQVAQSTGFDETAPASEERAALRRGDSLGRYIVLERLGSGGMGVVYAAYDPELDRKVAVKLLQPEAPEAKGEQGPARMLREAQALARLSHPNIIPVFDVGTWGEQVFIAMEYLDGRTLKDWLGEDLRPWREVLSVFLPAGRGLAAAHAAGLVHRDFKPSNVFIGQDGRVRVLDFGLARAAGAKDTESTPVDVFAETKMTPRAAALAVTLTGSGLFMGTPVYMAPEQLMQLPTDPRTDQFAFCVALYEGLYGERPFAADKLETLIFEVTKGKVKEAPKSSNVPSWIRAILLRGLQPNPDERYPSMEGLLTELQKDPAIARRRWLKVAAVASLAVVSVLGYRQVRHQQIQLCKGAEQELAGIWNPEKRSAISRTFLATGKPYAQDAVNGIEKAFDAYTRGWVAMQTEACEATRLRGKQSEELLDLRMQCLSQRRQELKSLVDIFASADSKVVEKSVQAAQALTGLDGCADATALKAPVRPPADAATRAKADDLRKKLATVKALGNAGKYREGLAIAAAVDTEAKALHYRPVEAEALYELGMLRFLSRDYKAGEEVFKDALLAAEAGRHDEIAAKARIVLVSDQRLRSRYDDAHESAKQAYAAIERLGGNDKLLISLEGSLGNLLISQGKPEEGLDHHQRALALQERMGPEHPMSASHLVSIGWAFDANRRYAEARQYYERGLRMWQETGGANHPGVGGTLGMLCSLLSREAKYDEALSYCQRAQVVVESTADPAHSSRAEILSETGWVLFDKGLYEQSLAFFQRALAIYEQPVNAGNPDLKGALQGTGNVLTSLGKYEQALAQYRRGLAIAEKTLGSQHKAAAHWLVRIGRVLLEQGKLKDALGHFQRSRAMLEEARGAIDSDMALALNGIGNVLTAQRRYGLALEDHQRALAIYEKTQPPHHPAVAYTLTEIGQVYLRVGEPSKAVSPLEQAVSIYKERPGDPNHLAETRFALARALKSTGGDQTRAISLASTARETFAAAGPMRKKDLAEVDRWLAGKR